MSEYIVPRLYIGVGGSGRSVVALIKKSIEASALTHDQKRACQYLAIDAEQFQEGDCRPLDRDKEFVYVGGFHPNKALASERLASVQKDWWYEGFIPSYVEKGAGAVRSIGRLAFFYHYYKIQDRIQSAIFKCCEFAVGRDVAPEVHVYIVGSLAGGTGSSMFLDLGLIARKACATRKAYINAVLMLPDVFTVTEAKMQQQYKDRWMANGYAALKELVYFNEHPKEFTPCYRDHVQEEAIDQPQLFEQCLFIEPLLNSSAAINDQKSVYRLVAETLRLYTASAHGVRTGASLVNAEGVNYASIGMQAIAFPRARVTEYARHWVAAQFLRNAAAGADALDNKEIARTAEAFLAKGGWHDLTSKVVELDEVSPEFGAPAVSDKLLASIRQQMQDFLDTAESRREPLNAMSLKWQREFLAACEAKVTECLQRGKTLSWVRAFLGHVVNRLEDQRTALDRGQGDAEKRVQNAKNTLDRLRPAGWFDKLLGTAHNVIEEAEGLLIAYGQAIKEHQSVSTGLQFVQLVQNEANGWLECLKQMQSTNFEEKAGTQDQLAARVADQFSADQATNPYVQYTVQPTQLHELMRKLQGHYGLGADAAVELWNFIRTDGTVKGLDAVIDKITHSLRLDHQELNLLNAWLAQGGLYEAPAEERETRRKNLLAELKEKFRSAALTCHPFWSCVQELAHERLAEERVVATPSDPLWGSWASEVPKKLDCIEGDEDSIVFLIVEGSRYFDDVHLQELPKWCRTYEQVQRAYKFDKEDRPLHAHRDWEKLQEIPLGLLANTGTFFGVAFKLGFIVEDPEKGGYVLVVSKLAATPTGQADIFLGQEWKEAVEALSNLDRETGRRLYAAARRELKAQPRMYASDTHMKPKYRRGTREWFVEDQFRYFISQLGMPAIAGPDSESPVV